MSGLKEALDDIAAEISPVDPPVELTMLLGKRIRNGRLAAVVGGTAGTIVLGVGALLGFPALAGHGGRRVKPGGRAAGERRASTRDRAIGQRRTGAAALRRGQRRAAAAAGPA